MSKTVHHHDLITAGQIQQQDLFDEDDDDDDMAVPTDVAADSNVVDNDDVPIVSVDTSETGSGLCRGSRSVVCRYVVTMTLLTAVNLINYMDRFSVAGQSSQHNTVTIMMMIV